MVPILFVTGLWENVGDHTDKDDEQNPECWCEPTLHDLGDVRMSDGKVFNVTLIDHDFSKKKS